MIFPKPQTNPPRDLRQRVSSMTVCIAAIAADSKAIVCIADRAVTYAGYAANSESDSGVAKIIDLPGNWCALFSCENLTLPKRILDRIAQALSNKPIVTFQEIETAAREAFNHFWWKELEEQFLTPILLTKDDFWARPTNIQPLDSELILKVTEKMSEHKQYCSIIFCGFEGDTPHLFVVSTPCQVDLYDWQGFAVVGAGIETARNQMLWAQYDQEDSLASVLYDVFNAKVATEVLQALGYAWNWRLIVPGQKPEPLPKDIDKLIDKLWIESNQSPFGEKSRRKPEIIEEWKKKVRAFTAAALASSKKSKTKPPTPNEPNDQP